MTLAQIRANVQSNLNDAGITYFSEQAINDSIQDAYNEVAAKCRCIINSSPINQVANQPYYDFLALGVGDYLGTIAIFNQETQYWLRDDVSLRDFDRLRRDWEQWYGQPQFWAPHSQRLIAVAPNLSSVSNQLFTLWYWGIAPILSSDSSVPLIASDMQPLLEFYATGDLIQNAEEVSKAQTWFQVYERDREKYKARCADLARADILLRV
jgi:hypothetical protein